MVIYKQGKIIIILKKKNFSQSIIKKRQKKNKSKWIECLTLGMEKPDKPTKITISL